MNTHTSDNQEKAGAGTLAGSLIPLADDDIDYLNLNKHHWNESTETHWTSSFYNVEGWLKGTHESVREPELSLLPSDLTGLKTLHLQCHFGQDTLSLARKGADVTGVDLSERAIDRANELSKLANVPGRFVQTNVYDLDLPGEDASFDLVFSS